MKNHHPLVLGIAVAAHLVSMPVALSQDGIRGMDVREYARYQAEAKEERESAQFRRTLLKLGIGAMVVIGFITNRKSRK